VVIIIITLIPPVAFVAIALLIIAFLGFPWFSLFSSGFLGLCHLHLSFFILPSLLQFCTVHLYINKFNVGSKLGVELVESLQAFFPPQSCFVNSIMLHCT
jgi:hypothetical protein